MNEPDENNPEQPCCCRELRTYVRENPTQVVLAAAGLGLLLALLLGSRKSARPEHRAVQILEDIQHRLKDLAEPAYRRALSAADKGAAAVKEGVERLEEMDLPSSVCALSKKLKGLFR